MSTSSHVGFNSLVRIASTISFVWWSSVFRHRNETILPAFLALNVTPAYAIFLAIPLCHFGMFLASGPRSRVDRCPGRAVTETGGLVEIYIWPSVYVLQAIQVSTLTRSSPLVAEHHFEISFRIFSYTY